MAVRVPCLGVTHLFFDEDPVSEERAKRICSTCPISAECLEYALATNQEYGVWGGLSPVERLNVRRVAVPGGTAPNQVTYTTTARSTGATCSSGRSPEGGWSVVCRAHGSTATAPTRTVAGYSASRPERWCPTCRRIAAGEIPKLAPLRALR